MPNATSLAGVQTGNLGSPTAPGIWLAGGGLQLEGSGSGYGILIVTGPLTIADSYTWEGLILVVGEGSLLMSGGSTAFGAIMVANTLAGGRTELDLAGSAKDDGGKREPAAVHQGRAHRISVSFEGSRQASEPRSTPARRRLPGRCRGFGLSQPPS